MGWTYLNGQFSVCFGGGGLNRCATLACAFIICCCYVCDRCAVHPGLYSSRLSCVNVQCGCRVIPATPASSYFLSAKNSDFPGGGCICLLCTSAVAWSCSKRVIARGRCGGFPYSSAGISEYISGRGGSRFGGLVSWHRCPIWLDVCR